jgi:hypothetical protein
MIHNAKVMNKQIFLMAFSLFIFVWDIFCQPNQTNRLTIPWLDPISQSNVEVKVFNFPSGISCPIKYTNELSNTNLFSLKEQKLIEKVFVKYKSVTTNVGPSGTRLVDLEKTNITFPYFHGSNEVWVSHFQYTNSDAVEEILVGGSTISARFRTKSNEGYNVWIGPTGNGTMLQFAEIKNNLICGILVDFNDNHPQGENRNFRLADFSNSRLTLYQQYTNGMAFGKYLMWNPRNNNLLLEADFKEPYDFERHRIDLRRAAEIRSRR